MDFSAIQKARASFEQTAQELGKNPKSEKVREVVRRNLAIDLSEDEARMVADDAMGDEDPRNPSRATTRPLALVLRPYLPMAWVSQTHTASPLFAFGSGPGSEELVGFRHNTELFRIMQTALGTDR